MRLTLSKVAEFTRADAGEFNRSAVATRYSIDSRTIRPGDLFFAVKGEKLDGHDFLQQALENGAIAAVVERDRLSSIEWRGKTPGARQAPLLAVDDTLEALQLLARAVRKAWARSLVAVTGSAGKT